MKKPVKIILIIIGFLAMVVLTAVLMPFVLSLSEPANRAVFKQFVDSLGFWGVLLLLLIQMLQVIIAFIPGEPVEVLAGAMYGTVGGMVLCLVGILLSTVIIYYTVRRFGRKLVDKIYKKEESKKYSFLFESKNITYLVFLLFLMPGTPKDTLTYLCPFTKMKPIDFFILSTFARIPSVVTSTYAGATISEGNFTKSLFVFAITGVIGVLGILLNNAYIKRKKKQ